MKYLYAFISWGIVALGAVHMLATFQLFHALNSAALWFFSGGIAIVLTGALNLLNRVYGHNAPALRRVCFGTNVLMAVFGVLTGIVSHAGIAQFFLVLGPLGGAAALSLSRIALRHPAEVTD